jgi:malate dehydrogenase (oxaloacetate-decarboxylating)
MTQNMNALKFHEQLKGKIEIISRVPINSLEDLSLAYTPGVAEACNAIVENPARVYDLTRKNNMVAVITDGSAVLGLGNIGPEDSVFIHYVELSTTRAHTKIDIRPYHPTTSDRENLRKRLSRRNCRRARTKLPFNKNYSRCSE